jgi:phenylacetate-CoA ligase
MDLEAVYLSLPLPLQTVALNLEGWRLERRRYAPPYPEMESEVVSRVGLAGNALQEYQARRLGRHFRAALNSPYWKRRFDEFGLLPDAEDPFAELMKLPVLTKAEVKAAAEAMLNLELDFRTLSSRHTSGTTGSGLKFWETRDCERETWATWWRYRYWHGLTRKTWCGYFGGRSLVSLKQKSPPYWRKNSAGRQIMFSAYHLGQITAQEYFSALADHQVEWLHGYPSIISLLAKYKVALGVDYRPRIISFGAESLTAPQRAAIIEAFPDALLIQHYGQAEAVANISQCRCEALHVDEDFSWVEFLPLPDQPGLFRLIGTNWTNAAFPLFRYDTGDIVSLNKPACSCGSSWRVVGDIDGRIEDFVELPNGAKVGRLDHIFKDMVNIAEAQIRQDKSGNLILAVVRGDDYSDGDEKALLDESRKRLGNEINIGIEYYQTIPRTGSGKLRLVVKAD